MSLNVVTKSEHTTYLFDSLNNGALVRLHRALCKRLRLLGSQTCRVKLGRVISFRVRRHVSSLIQVPGVRDSDSCSKSSVGRVESVKRFDTKEFEHRIAEEETFYAEFLCGLLGQYVILSSKASSVLASDRSARSKES